MVSFISFVFPIYHKAGTGFLFLSSPFSNQGHTNRSCFLRIFVSTTAIIYSKLFSLTLPKFVMLMRLLDDAIWNMRSFLKALGKLFYFLLIVSNILPSVHFGASSYALCIRNDSRMYAEYLLECIAYCFTFVTYYVKLNRSSRWRMFFKIGVLKNFAIFTRTTCVGAFLN